MRPISKRCGWGAEIHLDVCSGAGAAEKNGNGPGCGGGSRRNYRNRHSPHKPGRKLLGTTPKASRLLYQNGADQSEKEPLDDLFRRLLRLLRPRFSSPPEKFEKFEIHYLLVKLFKLLESTTKVESK